jgi:PucR family transcriptional regulator, purine catabolism regulatory protein
MDQINISLNDILRLVFPSENITWLTDKKNLDTQIDWVSTNIDHGQAGDLLIMLSKNANKINIRLAEEKGFGAILIIGKQPDLKYFPQNTIALAIETQKGIRHIHREITQLLTSKSSGMSDRKFQIHTKLTKLAADGVGLDGLARAMLEITRHGVLIHDKRLNIIAEAPSPDLFPIWGEISRQFNMINNLPAPLQNRQLAGEQNIKITQNISGGISRIIVPIIVGSVVRGYLSVIGLVRTLDILDHLVAEEGALICAIDMSRSKAVRETEKKLQSDLLTALLQEKLSPRDAGLWIAAVGLDRNQAHVVLQFSWDSPNPPSRRRLETLINGEVGRMGIKVILNPAGDAVICFCQVQPGENGYQLALDLGTNVLKQSSLEFPHANLRCGVGSPAIELEKWHISFREAGLALDLATRLKEDIPLYYPDLSVYRLLLLLETNPALDTFLEDTLGTLLKHEKKDEFIRTLEAYFEQKNNLSQTAEVLFIHRNTLSYRLKQIGEISGLDLKNYDSALAVQLALKTYRIIQNKRDNS